METDRIFLNDGVILNSTELQAASIEDYILRNDNDNFFEQFRGPFSGFFYDKRNHSLIVYTNHTGEKAVYYFENREHFIISSSLFLICETLNANKIKYSFNELAANLILTYYHLVKDITIVEEIKRLRPGYFLRHEEKCTLCQYWELKHNIDESILEEEAIENIDRLFRKAVAYQFEKDREYGYDHFVTLSGGLDSRMVCVVAHDLGYHNQTAFHFSSAEYFEEQIARRIALDLGIQYIYKYNNDCNVYLDPEGYVKKNYGNAVYAGCGELLYMLERLIGVGNYGIVHGGQIGDAILGGSFLSEAKLKKPDNLHVESSIVPLRSTQVDWDIYDDDEQKNTYERGFTGCMSTHQLEQHFTEECSPFIYPEFMEYCFKLPLKYRYKSYIYKKWICKKYPKAGEYIWEKTGCNLYEKDIKRTLKDRIKRFVPQRIIAMRRNNLRNSTERESMNPVNKWYKENSVFRNFINSYFEQNIKNLEAFPDTMKDCVLLFEHGNAFEKLFVITVLSSQKVYFDVNS